MTTHARITRRQLLQRSLPALIATTMLAACGSNLSSATPSSAPSTTNDSSYAPQAPAANASAEDLLADVKQRGKLVIATDANYKPQSYKNPDGSFEGFDVDVAREIARRLGVEPEIIDVSFDVVTAGGWNGRWDINVGSLAVTPERKKALLFTNPYYYTPAAFAVAKDSKVASVNELAGKKIGVPTATTYLSYMQNKLSLEGERILMPAPAADPNIYDSEQTALADLALGEGVRIDAALLALPTIQDSIKNGQPVKVLGDPVYYEDLAVVLDQTSPKDSHSLTDAISKIIDQMHQDGTLVKLSNKYYGIDLTSKR